MKFKMDRKFHAEVELDCRHTYCFCMDAAGMPPKVLQTDMRHADMSATMEADVLKKVQKKPLVK